MKIGIVGLGNMGEQIAAAVARAGHETLVYDVRPESVERMAEQGSVGCSSVLDVAKQSDVVSVVVFDEKQASAVADEIVKADGARTIVLHTTVTPGFVRSLATAMSEHGIAVVDAMVAGGVARARTGSLTVMVGGDPSAIETAQPIFDAIGRDVFVVGPAGAGAATKLAVNFMTIASYALEIEAMEFAREFGLTEDALSSVLTTSSADSRAVRTWGFHDRLRRTQIPGTAPSSEVMSKDVSSFAAAGKLAGLDLPLASAAAESLITQIAARDAWIDGLEQEPQIPRCSVCTLELIAPFRDAGVHPECAA